MQIIKSYYVDIKAWQNEPFKKTDVKNTRGCKKSSLQKPSQERQYRNRPAPWHWNEQIKQNARVKPLKTRTMEIRNLFQQKINITEKLISGSMPNYIFSFGA